MHLGHVRVTGGCIVWPAILVVVGASVEMWQWIILARTVSHNISFVKEINVHLYMPHDPLATCAPLDRRGLHISRANYHP